MSPCKPVKITLPEGCRCAVVITYDTDMAGGYSPTGVCHGRTAPFLMDYIYRLCEVAEDFGIKLQFFQIANGLELESVVSHVKSLLKRGHAVDCHTYNHVNLAYASSKELSEDLKRANELFERKLGFKSRILRGPGGYRHLDLKVENQKVILENGFTLVSGEFDYDLLKHKDWRYMASAPSRNLPFIYPSGLIEVPIQGWTDRAWFDSYRIVNPRAYRDWRLRYGHKPVPEGWRCPWTDRGALSDWIKVNVDCLNYAYEHRLVWVLCWHPYSHYLHDPDNKVLPTFLEEASRKEGKILFWTMRDLLSHLELPANS
ncbi:hypothetical protein CW702_00800 [Candidatus Bathyarchaeota archaeon]|nr:MAG: hypothetical protein CW702_00800 [Candidatus Bathyarchaeota archaeon]